MARKTYNEKLHGSKDLPKIEDISDQPRNVARLGGSRMLIAAPMQYNDIMAMIPDGQVITSDLVREYLARCAGADFTCPLTAGIFINICAGASEERAEDKVSYWRVLRSKGELNEKFPGGLERHRALLESEGHTVIQRGKRLFMQDYEHCLADLNALGCT